MGPDQPATQDFPKDPRCAPRKETMGRRSKMGGPTITFRVACAAAAAAGYERNELTFPVSGLNAERNKKPGNLWAVATSTEAVVP